MSPIDLSFRIGGEAGQGVESSGAGFTKALVRGGLHVFGVPDYYSRIRGGHNFFTIRASDSPVYAGKETIELLLALNAETVDHHIDSLAPGGGIIVDQEAALADQVTSGRDVRLFRVPLGDIAERHGGPVMVNTAVIGVAAGLVGLDLDLILGVIRDNFGKKGESVVRANHSVAEEAFAMARQRYGESFPWRLQRLSAPPRLAINGNQAFAMGALAAGCKFVAGYPMTPATSVLEYMAKNAGEWGVVAKHAEDEIAAVNMCVGAAHAGVRAMAPTSGGGFDLMTEGLSLAGMTEVPLVIYLAQRPGPATGLATRTAQGDLLLAIHASHGEFPRAVLAPHTPQEAFWCAARAFNIAEKYQCLVVVLSDQYNATSVWSSDADQFHMERLEIERGKLLTANQLEALSDYNRYEITADGVSPRALPGSSPKAVYLSTGNEHREDGHITEDQVMSAAMLSKRLRKAKGIRTAIRPPYRWGPDDAQIAFVSWGSTFGPVYEAMNILNEGGGSARMVHFVDVWPFPTEATRQALAGARRLIDVEGNAGAQFASLLHSETGIRLDDRILKYDGRAFTPEYIVDRMGEG